MPKYNPNARRRARHVALQAMYQWQMTENNIIAIEAQFMQEIDPKKVDIDYFRELLHGIPKQLAHIDNQYEPFLDRAKEELNPIEMAILRIATYEFLFRKDVPYKVIINEALEMAKTFGAIEGYKYVNAVLDKVAKVCREKEF